MKTNRWNTIPWMRQPLRGTRLRLLLHQRRHFQPASLPSSSGPMIPNNCQADKEACLLREQEAIANINEQTKTCNAREEMLMNQLNEQTTTCKAREDLLTAQFNTANAELLLKQQQQPKCDAMLAEESIRRARHFRYQGCYTESRDRVLGGEKRLPIPR